MFDSNRFENLRAAVADASGTRLDLASPEQLADVLRTTRSLIDRLEGLESQALHRFDAVDGYQDEGASSLTGWVRRELRMSAPDARARVKAGRTLTQLPQVAEAMHAGTIRLAHVREFGLGITKVGQGVMDDAQDYLLPVAQVADPADLRDLIGRLAEVVHRDDLDEKWARGMERNDVQLSKVGEGFHLTGFLDIPTGAAFKTWLQAAAAPVDADDVRPPSQRRTDALRQLVQTTLEHGMGSDRGIRPQLHVTAPLDAFSGSGDPDGLSEPADLAGFGPIGKDLLDYLRCGADVTGVLVAGETTGPTPQANVLNVGRRHRTATTRQRTAVQLRQGGSCAAPGCTNTHLDVHHVAWWMRDDGPTDLDNLVGLCVGCHHLIHRHLLAVDADGWGGFTFTRRNGRPLEGHRRQQRSRLRRHLAALRRIRDTPPAATPAAPASTRPPAQTGPPARDTRRLTPTDLGYSTISLGEKQFEILLEREPHRRT